MEIAIRGRRTGMRGATVMVGISMFGAWVGVGGSDSDDMVSLWRDGMVPKG